MIEAEGWLAHGSTPDRFARDLERYTQLILHGWLVLRFGRDEILEHPERVAAAIEQAMELRIVSEMDVQYPFATAELSPHQSHQ